MEFGRNWMQNRHVQLLKEKALRAFANARGWRTPRRIIVFESDDWGAIRMRDLNALNELRRNGLQLDNSRYHVLDCLENREDLERLFELLDGHRDQHGNPPTFTINAVMGNPDFEAIRKSQFERYFHESLWNSYERYYGEDLRSLWTHGIRSSLIQPQFHGREHLNVRLWMNDLRNGCEETRCGFEQEYYGFRPVSTLKPRRSYLEAYWPLSAEHLGELQGIVSEGLDMFQKFFGFRSETFVACNYILPKELESTTAERGVRLFQGQRGQIRPSIGGDSAVMRSFTGMQNLHGQFYSVRNVMFEPYKDETNDWVASAMKEIRESFAWGKPAVVCTHRINFVSGLNRQHRDRTLVLLDELLAKILMKWPDIEFLSSDRLLAEIEQC